MLSWRADRHLAKKIRGRRFQVNDAGAVEFAGLGACENVLATWPRPFSLSFPTSPCVALSCVRQGARLFAYGTLIGITISRRSQQLPALLLFLFPLSMWVQCVVFQNFTSGLGERRIAADCGLFQNKASSLCIGRGPCLRASSVLVACPPL